MKDAPGEGFRPGRTGSSLLWDEGNRRDGDQPARRVRTRRGGEGCGGHYVFVGGSDAARAAVHSALDASRFDWDLVEEEIKIRITDCGCVGANPGEIILDEEVLTDPRFGPKYAWGIVHHEYAHQVDFFLSMPATAVVSGNGSPAPTGATKTPRSTTTITPASASPPRSPGPTGPDPATTSWPCTRLSRRRNSARCSRGSSDPTTSRSRRKGCQEEDRHPH